VLARFTIDPAVVNISPLQGQRFTATAESTCGTPLTSKTTFSWWLSSPSLGLLNSSDGPAVAYTACLAPMGGLLHAEATSGGVTLYSNSTIAVTLQNPGWQDPSSNSSSGALEGSGASGPAETQREAAALLVGLLVAGAVAVVLYGRRKGRRGEREV